MTVIVGSSASETDYARITVDIVYTIIQTTMLYINDVKYNFKLMQKLYDGLRKFHFISYALQYCRYRYRHSRTCCCLLLLVIPSGLMM